MADDINFRFIDEPRAAEKALAALAGEEELAVDLEADSLHNYEEKVCLVQISSSSSNIVIDPLACGEALPLLGEICSNRSILKVFHGGDYDIRLLKKGPGFRVCNIFDTMVAAQFASRNKYGLAPLLEEDFDVTLDKKYQRADWSSRPLSREMLQYAALDTAYLLPLKKRLEDALLHLDRLSWVREEFRLLEDIEPSEAKAPSAYKVKGAGRLTPETRGRLQRLLEIRDQAARAMDRPPFKVLSNQVIVGWANNPPATERDILASPGVSRKVLARLAKALDSALRTPLLPEELLPALVHDQPPLTPEQKKLLQRLKSARAALEGHLGLPPGILVNSATLEKLCRMEAGEAGAFIAGNFKEWQRALVGERFAGILASGPFLDGESTV